MINNNGQTQKRLKCAIENCENLCIDKDIKCFYKSLTLCNAIFYSYQRIIKYYSFKNNISYVPLCSSCYILNPESFNPLTSSGKSLSMLYNDFEKDENQLHEYLNKLSL